MNENEYESITKIPKDTDRKDVFKIIPQKDKRRSSSDSVRMPYFVG
jgi:hypothetical protein